MFSLLLLIGLCVGYYYLHQYYPREQKEMYYFGGFVVISLLLIYVFNFENAFVYKVFKHIHNIQNKPLYDLSDFINKDDEVSEFNTMLLRNQGSRCAKCKNFILPSDSQYLSLQYRVPLDQGGTNDHNNLIITCPNCSGGIF